MAAGAEKKNVKYVRRAVRASDLKNCDLVFCASDDETCNRSVSRLCRARRIWVNVADRPELCSFILSSVFRRGRVTAAFSTGGASPAVAKFLRKRMEKYVGPEIDRLVRMLAKKRKMLLSLNFKERRALLDKWVNEAALHKIKRGQKIGNI
ncbi:MAG: hypothetical protein A2901_02735 [Elusimicrobia bacterium RIFCSPLOWO2_01_FULL_54_10]|nr:MAG: hypothetical protein A2901_02735 [Elusimicrobia bacterium RIFCSPLOWO2_01_FULL_54_10]